MLVARREAIARAKQPEPASFRTMLELTVAQSELEHDIVLAVFDISHVGDEFSSFVYKLDVGGVVQTETFATYAELLAFFEDESFLLGGDFELGDVISATFDVILDQGSRFDMAVAFAAVPEPGTGLLVCFALIVLGAKRRTLH